MQTREARSWVVYRQVVKGQPDPINAVCDAGEWSALEVARPGQVTLVRSGIASEAEAERLARGKSGDPVPRAAPRRG